MGTLINLIGQKFGRLTVIERMPNIKKKKEQIVLWKCKCECGNEVTVKSIDLRRGHTKSCGCLKMEMAGKQSIKHGKTNTRLYGVWKNMRERCSNPNNKNYKNYGGRGVNVCKEWDNFLDFYNWAILNGYNKDAKRGECTLDRIDVNGNYEPKNCRFVSMKIQNRNRRLLKSNKTGYNGVFLNKKNGKYSVCINIFVGYFDKKEDAIKARKAAEDKYYKII